MELTQLKYFSEIARHGHMTRAARALGVTQPALSAVVRKLEAEVGAGLLHRTGRGVELTEAGRVLLSHGEEALRRVDAGKAAVAQLAKLERGSVRVGGGATATTYLLPRAVSELRTRHPGLRFYVREAGSNAVAQAVASGELDIGIVTLPLKREEQAELRVERLVVDELRLIVPPGHRLAGRSAFKWKDLEGEPVVAFEAGTAVRELVDGAAARARVTLSVVMELRSIESIKRMVGAGIGVGFVSRFAVTEGDGLSAGGGLSRVLAVATREGRSPSAAVEALEKALARVVTRLEGR
jgi:LysR family cyn operon transcriptional activator